MVQINEVSPSRFRSGDLITIHGFGFSPDFGENQVAIGGIPEVLQSESATELTLIVPAGIPEDDWVSVFVFRSDSLDNASDQWWSGGAVSDLRDGTTRVPGQIPGEAERANPVRVEDVPQAQDYERLATAIEHLLFDVLSTVGDLFGFDGASLTPVPIGAAGNVLRANPAAATGMDYAGLTRAQTLSWGGRKAAGAVTLGSLTPNASSDNLGAVFGDHVSPRTGTMRELVVLFAEGSAGDTLDNVEVEINGAPLYASAAGLAIPPGGTHVVDLGLAINVGDLTQVRVRKIGTNGTADFVAQVEIR